MQVCFSAQLSRLMILSGMGITKREMIFVRLRDDIHIYYV